MHARGHIHAASTVFPITGGHVVVICSWCHRGDQTVDAALEFDGHMYAVWFQEM
jgi:hypothetical protein